MGYRLVFIHLINHINDRYFFMDLRRGNKLNCLRWVQLKCSICETYFCRDIRVRAAVINTK